MSWSNVYFLEGIITYICGKEKKYFTQLSFRNIVLALLQMF